jgi:tRNA-specific 2-thiouridylase
VIDKDIKKNVIYVANKGSEFPEQLRNRTSRIQGSVCKVHKISWVSGQPKLPLNCQVKIRYRSESIPATISRLNLEMGRLSIKFKKPVRALTPGQSAVFYRGQEVLGGGIIS